LIEDVGLRHPRIVVQVRGCGLMLGIKTTCPSATLVEALRREARVLTIAAGDNVTRVLPPLVVSDAEIASFAECLDRTLAGLGGAI